MPETTAQCSVWAAHIEVQGMTVLSPQEDGRLQSCATAWLLIIRPLIE